MPPSASICLSSVARSRAISFETNLSCAVRAARSHSLSIDGSQRHRISGVEPEDMDTTTTHESRATVARTIETGSPVLDLVIPVYNEEAGLERSVRTVRDYLNHCFP